MRYGAVTARSAGLYACPSCGLLSTHVGRETFDEPAPGSVPLNTPQVVDDGEPVTAECPRCEESLHVRKPASIAKTWAYIISAFILYIPANVLPITDTRTLFDDQSDTIFSGVVHLWQAGSWPLALLVFFASITVPVAKLIVLTGLNISVQRGTLRKPAQRTRLYRIVEFIGRWSMLDIFAVVDPHGAGPAQESRGGHGRTGGARVRRRLRPDHPGFARVRPAPDLGSDRCVGRRPGPRR